MKSKCGQGHNNPNSLNCAGDTDGANVLAALFSLDSNGQLDTSGANGIVSNIVSYGFTTASLTCDQSFVVDQDFSIFCNDWEKGEKVANNKNCVQCKQMVTDILKAREELEHKARTKNSNYQVQVPSSDLIDKLSGKLPNQNDGACMYVCMQCVSKNITQNLELKLTAECESHNSTFRTAFTKGMSLQAETEVKKHMNALKNTGFVINNKADITNLSTQLANTISTMTSDTIVRGLHQSALIMQSTQITPKSTSVVFANGSQNITTSMFSTLASKTYTDEKVKNAIDYNIRKDEVKLQTSFNDLVKDLEASVDTMESLLKTVVGKIIITIVALLMCALITFAAYFYFGSHNL
jgi:hypothetical protein